MPIACIYHKTQGMKVVSFEEREKLVASGEWFRHPNDLKEKEHEEPIRQQSQQGRKHAKHASKKNGSGTFSE